MNHFIDFHLLPDPEFTPSFLMNKLYAKLHRVLVDLSEHDYGVSFPGVEPTRPHLGNCLRVHGSEENLQLLMKKNWLTGMRDHLQVGAISLVPEKARHCRLRRVQPKSNVERLRRRYMKRHEVNEEEATRRIPDTLEQRVHLPFLRMKSVSTGQHFCMFIEHLPPQEQPVDGTFNSYGLSHTATVPWF